MVVGGLLETQHAEDVLDVPSRRARPVDAREELVEIGYALLEQVADAVGAAREQLERVARVDVLGEYDRG